MVCRDLLLVEWESDELESRFRASEGEPGQSPESDLCWTLWLWGEVFDVQRGWEDWLTRDICVRAFIFLR